MANCVLFHNGRIFVRGEHGLADAASFTDSMLIQDGKITALGSTETNKLENTPDLETRDLHQRYVLPGFIDGHMHLLLLGQSLRKVNLFNCRNLEDIKSTIKAYAAENPDDETIMCKGWMHFMTPDGVSASMLDEIDPRPIFVDNSSLHSCWCNTAALEVLRVADMADPPGGKIHRTADGKPSGVLEEGAMLSIVWPYQSQSAPKKARIEAIRAATREYNSAGYTGVVEMAMDEEAWDALVTLHAAEPSSPLRVAAYWLIRPTTNPEENSTQVQRAMELSRRYNESSSPNLKLVGVKLICDGIIDACTAHLSRPYGPDLGLPAPIWEAKYLEDVVREADAGGLQIALHAIGDATVKMAIDALEKFGTPGRRHRIEHLELVSPEDARRLGELGLTASVQPVHADPSILQDWPRLIGEERCQRAFAYREFADAGALMALGSDSPTSPWNPMHNLYVATTRKSSRKPGFENGKTVNHHFRLGLCESIVASTDGAARSVFAEQRVGEIAVGKSADFVVTDMNFEPEALLKAEIEETWFNGRMVYIRRPPGDAKPSQLSI